MATRGRKPKPTALKELEGNPGKRPLNKNEPKPAKKAPSCPKWLDDEAKKEWRRLAPSMEKLGILTEADRTAFASYCQAYSRWKAAEEFMTNSGTTIFKTPSGYWQQLPQVSIAQTYLKIMNRIGEQFGLTPAARSRIIAGEGTDDSTDEMESLLGGG
ncbi:MAG: phage terminase small subunit P27 family [Lachnospiraceae bacterium]|nr:phage terminase small subunit P27 family [Lachnospiraceae bacterium]